MTPPTTDPPAADAHDLWAVALARLQLQTTAAHFETYLRGTRGVSYDPGASVLRVAASNPFHVPFLESRFAAPVHTAIADVVGAPVRVEFVAGSASSEAKRLRERPRPMASRPLDRLMEQADNALDGVEQDHSKRRTGSIPEAKLLGSPLNSRYSFDNFIVGPSNQLAHAASQAVVDAPGQAYNPLFLYGGVGLGKTHLLHAIGQAVLMRNHTVVYVSSETFTNEMIESIRQNRNEEFRAKYRRTKLLLIDDVQFIAGKERTEEEFFHTFNAIHDAGGQIVLSSDRPPRAMTILQDRLRSRFEWGLIADIQAPDYETRVAILRSKLGSQLAGAVPTDVVAFIAQKIQSNIRELEGSLNRLLAYARHLRQPVTVELAAAALRDLVSPGQHSLGATPEAILQAVSRYFGVTADALRGKARHKQIVVPRQIAMYLMREDARLSTPEIGRILKRDHTTILHGANLVAHDIARDGTARASVRGVREVLATSA